MVQVTGGCPCDGFDSDLIAKIDASLRRAVRWGYIDKMTSNVSDDVDKKLFR